MAISGTDAYADEPDLPPLVQRALTAARTPGFPYSCRPEQGRLLRGPPGGAAEALRASVGVAPPLPEELEPLWSAECVERTRLQLAPEEFGILLERGRRLPVPDALALVTSSSPS